MKWYDEELWAWVTVALIAMFIMSHLSSCTTTKYVEVPVVKNHTTYKVDSVRDSIYVRDSTVIWMRGDTVFKDRWRDRVRDLRGTLIIKDTVTDTITKPLYITKTKEKAVEKELTWFQKLMLGSGKVVWICALLFALVWFAKRKL